MSSASRLSSSVLLSQSQERGHLARLLASSALMVMIATGLGGCKTSQSQSSDITGSINPTRSGTESRQAIETLGERHRANPRDPEAALRYAQALRGAGQRTQAAAVLEQATLVNPGHKALLGAYGRALADVGNFNLAFDILTRAHTPDNPDWRILSVQGAALDQMGRHEEARRYYASALKIVPGEPTVLSNLGLSYALSKELKRAETTLRQASERGGIDPRVRQNLALVVGLQGRFAEAETIAKADLSPDEAAANVAYLRQMLSREAELRKPQRS